LTDHYLHNRRMEDKFTKRPTPYELSQAFPDCRDVARRNIDELIPQVEYYKDLIRQHPLMIHFMSINPVVKRINSLQKYLDLTSPIHGNKIDLTKAKQVPIQSLYDFQKIQKSPGRIKAICPFVDEKTPSFTIYLKDNTCHCYSCGFHSDAIGFFQKLHNINFIEAVRKLGGL
jgi:hypothetical protein